MKETGGAFFTDNYRNLFKEYGYSETEIMRKVENTWNGLFNEDAETCIYTPVGKDKAYILDTGNLDVRTEGMSYGMMMSVQMDRKDVFDRLWLWTKTYMQHSDGKYKGYFAWSLNPDGTRRAEGPAPDGEEYFAMALFLASNRWGDGEEPFDYERQAKDILRECVHKGEEGEGVPMWDPGNKLIKFVPEAGFSDPSYHLPHFYELFSLQSDERDRGFWAEAAQASRAYLRLSCHPVTGLAPEYAEYDGSPHTGGGHDVFFSDSYRVAANIGLDYEWFARDLWQRGEAGKILSFFHKVDGAPQYNKYLIDGTPLQERALHPVGLLATNAMAALAADNGANAEETVRQFWDMPLRTGVRRYYDNCLYFFSVLALSGRYRIWKKEGAAR